MKNESVYNARTKWYLVSAITIFSAVLVILALLYYDYEEKVIRLENHNELKAIADLKSSQILNWKKERIGDAKVVSRSPFFAKRIGDWIKNRNDLALADDILKRLNQYKEIFDYNEVFLSSISGELLLYTNKNNVDFDTLIRSKIIESVNKKQIEFSDFYFCNQRNSINFDILTPVYDNNEIPVAVIGFQINPHDYLYPLIRTWPTPSKTAETLLLRLDGDSVLFLNELRHVANSALKLRISRDRKDVPAVKATFGYTGVFEGSDYRGVSVLSDIRSIQGTNWFMVSKIDIDEIYTELYFRAVVISIFVIVLILTFSIGIFWVYHFRQRNNFLQLYKKEKELFEYQKEFKTILYSIGDAVITTDFDGKVRQMNSVAEKLSGWSESDSIGLGLDEVFNIVDGDNGTKVDNSIQTVLKEGNVVEIPKNTILISKNGNKIPIADSCAPIINDMDEIIGVVFVFRDVKKDIELQKKILDSEKKYRQLFENAREGIFQTTIDGRYLSANKALANMYGYETPEELINSRINISSDTYKDKSSWEYFIQKIVSDGYINGFEYEVKRKDGSIIWIYEDAQAIKGENGDLLYFEGFVLDITERKRFEAELLESNYKITTLFEAMTEMLVLHEVVFDDNGKATNYRIIDCNRTFTDVTGISKELAVGKLASDLYGTQEAPYLDIFSEVAISGKAYNYETYFEPMDKHFSISVVSPGKNKFATVTTDITSVKSIQRIVANKNKELEQIVYVASHDLRSPLVNVDGYSKELMYSVEEIRKTIESRDITLENLIKVIKTELPDIFESLNHIKSSTHQMDLLLKGLLKLSRSGRAALNIEAIDMNELLKNISQTIDFQVKSMDIQLNISSLPSCRGDYVQLTQVFSNLIGNAMKFCSPERQSLIKITGKIESGKSVYCVEDNGIGIAVNHLDNIFELFHRLEPNKTEGEGLGLTIVRQIISRLEGEVKVESKLGDGSRFYVILPYAKIKEIK